MITRLNLAIEELYEVFGGYAPNRQMAASPLHDDMIDGWRKQLFGTPLRKLTSEQLTIFTGKAMTTWGDVPDFKHFLPRMLELAALHDAPYGFWIIIDKLEYGHWRTWLQSEQQALEEYLLALWINLLRDNSETAEAEFDMYLAAILTAYPGIEVLLEHCDLEQGGPAVKHLANHIYKEQRFIFDRDFKKGYVHAPAFANWLLRENTIRRLETAFYQYEKEEFAAVISWAEQILRSQKANMQGE